MRILDIDGEAVLYNPNDEVLHYLNHSAALVLDLCDGETTMREMADAISDVYEMPVEEIEPQVRAVVRDLRSRGVLLPTREPRSSGNGAAPDAPSEAAHASTSNGAADTDERQLIRMEVPRTS